MRPTAKLVGRVARERLRDDAMFRLEYPPFHVLVALVNGRPCAIEDACNHAGASLSEGSREGDCVSCPMHGYVFALGTGRLVSPRGLCGDQRQFVTSLVHEEIVVWDHGAETSIIGF